MFKGTGKLIYDPQVGVDRTGKAVRNVRKTDMDWWVKLTVSHSITGYYADWIRKETGRVVTFPLWGAHISVVRGEVPPRKTLWRAHAGKTFEFEYDPEICMNDKYAWLRVKSKALAHLRMELGLAPSPRCPFHITIVNFKSKDAPRENKSPAVTVFPWERPEFVAPNCQPF